MQEEVLEQAAAGPATDGREEAGGADARDWFLLAVLLALGAGVWLWFALSTRLVLEDAYITFRYARNLAEGLGFVFNPGERVLGTTTPLQTLLLAGLGRVFGPERIPLIAECVMPVFGLAAGAVMYHALRRLDLLRAGAAIGLLLFLLHPLVIRASLGGMETPLVLFLMALSLRFAAQRRLAAAALTVALLALCRLDGLIWGALVMTVALRQLRVVGGLKPALRAAGAFAAVWAPWLLFAALYYGSPVPNTVKAKGVIRPGREHLLFQPLHFRRLSHWYLSGTGLASGGAFFWIWLALLLLGAYAAFRSRRREALLLAVFPPVYAAAMYFGRAPMYQWYLLPMLFCCLFLAGLGIGQLASWANDRGRGLRLAAAAGAVVVLVPGLLNLAGDLPDTVRHTRLFQQNEWGLRRGIGLWLRNHTPAQATVAMEAIGYQGYFSRRPVIDMAGLATPRAVEFKRSTGQNGVVFRRITTELRPDYIILRSFEVDENHHFNGGKLFPTEADREEFFRHYREVRRFTAPHPELDPLVTHLTLYGRVR